MRVVKIEKKTSGKGKWMLSGVTLIAIAGIVTFMKLEEESNSELSSEPITRPIARPSNASTNSVKNSEPNALQQKIISLLTDADRAFQDNRFINPKGNNAQEYYQAVLLLDDSNKLANTGLLEISNKYLQRADKSIKQKKYLLRNPL